MMNIKQLLTSHKTFYVKRWQGNNYYPISKYEWINDNYVHFILKNSGWYSWGSINGGNNAIEYILLNNSCLISLSEFKDTNNYVNEGYELITE